MPIKPIEIMIGKIAPFVLIGFVQMAIIISAAHFVFGVPILGSVWLLVALSTLFAASNLAVGYTFSTVAQNQLQAVQMTFFFFLPNFLLSGFMPSRSAACRIGRKPSARCCRSPISSASCAASC